MSSIKINLKKTDEDLFMKSKWWGNPDLPLDVDAPDCSTFICQIRCDEIAQLDVDNRLPHKGMLYFFGELDYYLGDFDAYVPDMYWDSDDIKVLYVEDLENQEFEEVVFVDEDDNPYAFEPLAMEFSKDGDFAISTKLLGAPNNRQWEDWDEPFNGWVELLPIESDDYGEGSLNFMDCGVLHIILDPKDLANKNFDNVTAIVCSS